MVNFCFRCGKTREAHHQNVWCSHQDAAEIEEVIDGGASDSETGEPLSAADLYDAFTDWQYINVYEVVQCYGGPEEGGWWYYAGTPIESIKVFSSEKRAEVLNALHKRYQLDEVGAYYGDDPEQRRGSTSAAGGFDIVISQEYAFAQPYPTKRPRYE